jgi:hypothetical protein
MFVFNIIIFAVLFALFVKAYQSQQLWLRFIPYILLRWGKNRAFFTQLLFYSPIFVGWLMLCHWIDVKGLHGLAAAGMAFAMLLALQAMRMVEEMQKGNHGD